MSPHHHRKHYGAISRHHAEQAVRTPREGCLDDLSCAWAQGRGNKQEAIKALQRTLKNAGMDIGKSGTDGKFGSKTKAALVRYLEDIAHRTGPDSPKAGYFVRTVKSIDAGGERWSPRSNDEIAAAFASALHMGTLPSLRAAEKKRTPGAAHSAGLTG